MHLFVYNISDRACTGAVISFFGEKKITTIPFANIFIFSLIYIKFYDIITS